MRSTQEEESLGKSERIRELEAQTKAAEESLELARQRWEKDSAIAK